MEKKTDHRDSTKRLPWESPRLEVVGDLEEIVSGGQGKLSPTTIDPGDARKNPGSG
jgi:hypothetical protein